MPNYRSKLVSRPSIPKDSLDGWTIKYKLLGLSNEVDYGKGVGMGKFEDRRGGKV